jgi:hypothetical protein
MITSRRDYVMRIIEEVGRILARISAKRRQGDSDDAALETVVFGLQRLFNLDADQIFSLTPDQHFAMLADDESAEFARDKVLLYAALSTAAGSIYARLGKPAMARATFLNALRFTLRARAMISSAGLPDYTPKISELLDALKDERLDAETAALLSADPTAASQ